MTNEPTCFRRLGIHEIGRAKMHKGTQHEPVGSRIRWLRIERSLGQEQLALKAHVDQSGLSKFERTNKGLGSAALERIAAVLDTNLQSLTAGPAPRPR